MTILTDYAPEQQALLMRSPSAAAVAIAAASIGQARETAAEGFAAATYILESRSQFLDNALVGSMLYEIGQRVEEEATFPDFEREVVAPGAAEAALGTLREAATLVESRADAEEAAGFKRWLMGIARTTALGGAEGGNWLGWGAVQVNEAERVALERVAEALGLPHA